MRIAVSIVAALTLASGAALAGGAGEGTFSGLSNHTVSGKVEVVETAGGWEIHLGEDFSFDGAPDPRVGFGKGGTFVDPTDFELLRANSGAQVYKVPAEIDPTEFDNVFIWCRQYSVPLGIATIK